MDLHGATTVPQMVSDLWTLRENCTILETGTEVSGGSAPVRTEALSLGSEPRWRQIETEALITEKAHVPRRTARNIRKDNLRLRNKWMDQTISQEGTRLRLLNTVLYLFCVLNTFA